MAKLQASNNVGTGLNIEENVPAGNYIAVCLKIIDQFGVMRKKYQSEEEALRDVTRFVFGMVDPQGKAYLLQTYEFTISAAPGSNLMKFLKSWTGAEPQIGWDYCEMQGKPATVSVEQKRSSRNPGVIYSSISGIGPVFPQMQAYVPPAQMFANLLLAAEQPRQQTTPPPTPPRGQAHQQQRAPAQYPQAQAPQANQWTPPQAQAPAQPPQWQPPVGTPPPNMGVPPTPPAIQPPADDDIPF